MLVLAGLVPGSAPGQGDRLTRIIVAFPPGGPVDFVARTIAEPLGRELGTRVIVDNKPGGNGAIAAETVARAAPDGTTLWLTSVGAVAINPVLYDKLPYDVQRDFAPVSLVVNNDELLVVNANDPANTVPEFIANAKKRQGPTPIASTGIGSIPHLAMEQLADASKANLLHVPYKGAAPAITDVMGGQVAAFFGDIPGLIGHVKGGKLKAIGIAAPKRHPALPDVPTFVEQGIGGRGLEQLVCAVRAGEDAAGNRGGAQSRGAQRARDARGEREARGERRGAGGLDAAGAHDARCATTRKSGASSSATRRSPRNDPGRSLARPSRPHGAGCHDFVHSRSARAARHAPGARGRSSARSRRSAATSRPCIRRCSTARRSPRAGRSS